MASAYRRLLNRLDFAAALLAGWHRGTVAHAADRQKEISPSALQRKWLKLQRSTGNFQKIDDVMEADHGSEGTLVLVETSFNRMTDNIFIILNSANDITGVDFPIDSKVR